MQDISIEFIEYCFDRAFILYDILKKNIEDVGNFNHIMNGGFYEK